MQSGVRNTCCGTLVDLPPRGDVSPAIYPLMVRATAEWIYHWRGSKNQIEFMRFGGGDTIKRKAFTEAVELVTAAGPTQIPMPNLPWLN